MVGIGTEDATTGARWLSASSGRQASSFLIGSFACPAFVNQEIGEDVEGQREKEAYKIHPPHEIGGRVQKTHDLWSE